MKNICSKGNRKMSYILHAILIGLATTSRIAKSEGLVSYPNRTIVMMGISGTMNRISIDDTAHDNRTDLIVIGPSSFGSIRRGVTDNNILVSAYIDYSATIRGAESIDFLKENDVMRSMVVACSRNNLRYGGNKSPAGAIQVVREKFGTKGDNDPITVTTLIPSKNLQGPSVLMTEVNGRDVKAIDMNNDGYIDIVATVSGKSSNGKSVGFLLYFKNDGKDKFSTIVISESLNGKAVLDIGDFDQNGFLDIAVLGIDSSDLNVFYQEEDNTFTGKLIDADASTNYAITVGSFNGDSGADIFTLGRNGITGYLATMNLGSVYAGARDFTKNSLFTLKESSHLSKDYRSFQIKLHDADNDGITDILAIYGKQSGIKWMKHNSNGIINGPVDLVEPIVIAPDTFDIKDMNNDGIADIVVHSNFDDAVYMYLGQIE